MEGFITDVRGWCKADEEGNKNIALNFLKKAYSIDEETECYVHGKEYKPVLDGSEFTHQ